MSRIDVKDKDPFANAEAKPKDDITTFGFIFRGIIRYARITIIFYLIVALFYSYFFGTSIFSFFGL